MTKVGSASLAARALAAIDGLVSTSAGRVEVSPSAEPGSKLSVGDGPEGGDGLSGRRGPVGGTPGGPTRRGEVGGGGGGGDGGGRGGN
jgi:hypothetical protein